MRSRQQFLVWADGKRPISPNTLSSFGWNDPAKWTSLDKAAQVAADIEDVLGVGFALAEHEDIVCIDLDGCIENGEVHPEAQRIIDEMGSYSERSPSGAGVHIFVHAAIPKGHPTRLQSSPFGIEAYSHGRFLTVTGDRLGQQDQIADRTGEMLALFARCGVQVAQATNGAALGDIAAPSASNGAMTHATDTASSSTPKTAPAPTATAQPAPSIRVLPSEPDEQLLLKRGRQYALVVPPLSEGGGRNPTAYKLAGNLRRFIVESSGLQLNEQQLLSVTDEGWNSRNTPPLERAELAKAIANSAKYGKARDLRPVTPDGPWYAALAFSGGQHDTEADAGDDGEAVLTWTDSDITVGRTGSISVWLHAKRGEQVLASEQLRLNNATAIGQLVRDLDTHGIDADTTRAVVAQLRIHAKRVVDARAAAADLRQAGAEKAPTVYDLAREAIASLELTFRSDDGREVFSKRFDRTIPASSLKDYVAPQFVDLVSSTREGIEDRANAMKRLRLLRSAVNQVSQDFIAALPAAEEARRAGLDGYNDVLFNRLVRFITEPRRVRSIDGDFIDQSYADFACVIPEEAWQQFHGSSGVFARVRAGQVQLAIRGEIISGELAVNSSKRLFRMYAGLLDSDRISVSGRQIRVAIVATEVLVEAGVVARGRHDT
jgi:hypothetical protein